VAYLGGGPRCDAPLGPTMKIFYKQLYIKRYVFAVFHQELQNSTTMFDGLLSYRFVFFLELFFYIYAMHYAAGGLVSVLYIVICNTVRLIKGKLRYGTLLLRRVVVFSHTNRYYEIFLG